MLIPVHRRFGEGVNCVDFKLVYSHNLAKIYQLTDRVYFRLGNWPEKYQCNGGFIELEHCTLVVDAPSVEAANDMMFESQELFGKPVKYVFITHAHPDHIYGLPAYADDPDIVLIASWNARSNFGYHGVHHYPKQFLAIKDKIQVTLDGVDLCFEKIPFQAHSLWDSMLYLHDAGILFAGDLIVPQRNMFLKDCHLWGWRKALEDIMARGPLILARGHGEVCETNYMQKQIDYIDALVALNKLLRENVTLETYLHRGAVNILEGLAREGCSCADELIGGAGSDACAHLSQLFDYSVETAKSIRMLFP